jgi:hypothetical protein
VSQDFAAQRAPLRQVRVKISASETRNGRLPEATTHVDLSHGKRDAVTIP